MLHPEQVVTYPFAGLLPEELCAQIDAWEEALGETSELLSGGDVAYPVAYQYDLSIPPGWRVGGFASWHSTDPYPMDCLTCAAPMHLLLTIDSSEWDGGSGSWKPLEDTDGDTYRHATPTEVTEVVSANSTSSSARGSRPPAPLEHPVAGVTLEGRPRTVCPHRNHLGWTWHSVENGGVPG